MIKFLFNLTDKQYKKLKELSEKTGLKKAEILRRMIDDYFNKHRREGKNN